MEDVLIGLEDPKIVFLKRNNFIYLGIVLVLVTLNIYLSGNAIPAEKTLKLMGMTRLQYAISSFIGIFIAQVIALLLSLMLSLLPIKKMLYRHKMLRVFLVTAVVVNVAVLALMFIH